MLARKIEVVEYDPEWPKMFKEEAKEIRRILGRNCTAVYHIGSTAVKEMRAKPIIDILAVVKNLDQVDECNARFEAQGYECLGEYGIAQRRFFRKGGEQPTHHVYVFAQDNQSEIRRHLAVVEYLSGNARRREEYSEMKTYLAEAYPDDPESYCEGKVYFVTQLEQEALNSCKPEEKTESQRSAGVSIGMGLGLVLGLTVFDNIGVGLCIGLCIGLAIGAAKKRKD